MSIKSLVQSLLDLFVKKTELGDYLQESDSEWIGNQALPQLQQTQYDVTSDSAIVAPFDGTACLYIDGSSATAIKNARIASSNIYAAVYSTGDDGMRYFRQWVPIVKGRNIGVSYSGTGTATLRCNPTIGSGQVTS